MKIRNFETDVWLPRPRDQVFDFFSDVANLDAITPPWVKFKTITPGPIEMRVGTVIDHRLRIHGVPIRWRSKITAWEPPRDSSTNKFAGHIESGSTSICLKKVMAALWCGIAFVTQRPSIFSRTDFSFGPTWSESFGIGPNA